MKSKNKLLIKIGNTVSDTQKSLHTLTELPYYGKILSRDSITKNILINLKSQRCTETCLDLTMSGCPYQHCIHITDLIFKDI